MPGTAKEKSGRKRRAKKAAPTKKKDAGSNFGNLQEDEGDIDFQTLVQREYMKLHRQYRIMEDARRALTGKGKSLSKKEKFLEKLRLEKENLETDILNAECGTFKERDRGSRKTILDILDDLEACEAEIEVCWKNINEMVTNVDKITKRLVEQKLKVQAMYGSSMTVPQADHRKRILEDRLYHATTQLDTKVSANKELRDEINMNLRLRGIFYTRLIAMKRVINHCKMKMGEVVYLASQAYEQRDDWVAKIKTLRERNDKDSKQHVLEIKEFNRVLHHDSKLHGFMSLKNRERELMESNAQRVERKNRIKLEDINAMLQDYEHSFNRILKFAKSRNIEHLVHNYLGLEQANFSRFKYITDLNHEINYMRDQNVVLANQIEVVFEQNKHTDKMRKERLTARALNYEKENGRLDKVIEVWDAAEVQMEGIVRLLDAMFDVSKCGNAPIVRLLGNMKGVNPRNISLCMRVIESRVHELVQRLSEYELRESVEINGAPLPKKQGLGTTGPRPKNFGGGGPYSPKITVTGHQDGEQEEEDEDKVMFERPLTYGELKQRLLDKLAHSVRPDANSNGPNGVSRAASIFQEADASGTTVLAGRSKVL